MASGFKAQEQEIVKALIDTKAVNFEAIGAAVAKFGASATLALDGEDWFCGTMRRFIRLFRITDQPAPLETLAELQQIAKQIKG
jgi:hypothetical protein